MSTLFPKLLEKRIRKFIRVNHKLSADGLSLSREFYHKMRILVNWELFLVKLIFKAYPYISSLILFLLGIGSFWVENF